MKTRTVHNYYNVYQLKNDNFKKLWSSGDKHAKNKLRLYTITWLQAI